MKFKKFFSTSVYRVYGSLAELASEISNQIDQTKKPIQLKPIVKEVLKLIRAFIPSTIDINTAAIINNQNMKGRINVIRNKNL